MLLRLLAAALTPLVRQTHTWIASGVLHDPASEFFITKGELLGASLAIIASYPSAFHCGPCFVGRPVLTGTHPDLTP